MLLFFRLQLRRAGRSPVDFACFSDRGMKNALYRQLAGPGRTAAK